MPLVIRAQRDQKIKRFSFFFCKNKVKLVYFFLGALIPLPVFFDLNRGDLLFEQISDIGYLANFGAPVPIGFFAFALLIVASGVSRLLKPANSPVIDNRSINLNLFLVFLFVLLFSLYSLTSLDVKRLVSLLVPHLALLGTYILYKDVVNQKFAIKGFLFSIYSFILFHAISIIIFESMLESANKELLFASFFGYIIYQSHVSYSAVLSFFACTLIVMSSAGDRGLRQAGYSFIIIVIFFILGYGARKAVLMDLLFVLLSFLMFAWLQFFHRSTITSKDIGRMLFICFIAGYLILFSGFNERSLTVDAALDQRGGAYESFVSIIQASSAVQLLFGHAGGWGGFSNLFIEFFVRLGIIGFLLYFASIYFMLRFFRHRVSVRHKPILSRFSYYSKNIRIWLFFAVFSVLGANLINMNLQLPYYVINLTLITLLVTSQSFNGVTLRAANNHVKHER
jgi:hypothetical protein